MLRTPPATAFNTYLLEVTSSPALLLSPNLMRIKVASRYGTARFLLAFSAASLPADGTVPIMEPIPVGTTGTVIERSFSPQGLLINSPGLVFVASSTAATLTKDTSATWDFECDIEEYETRNPNATAVGDLTNAVSSRTIWSEATGAASAKKLLRANIINGVAAVRYAVVYAEDTPDSGSRIITWRKLAASQKLELNFGMNDGLTLYQKDADGTEHAGCVIAAQTDLVPGNISVGTDFKIQAYYR
jgi:hypothetical protein